MGIGDRDSGIFSRLCAMLGKRKPQRELFSSAPLLGAEAVEKMGFYGKLAGEGSRIFRDEDFAEIYCSNNGRPSVPPSLLCIARLLQFYDGVSDAEVVARTQYDLRWKVALDLDPLSVEAPFVKSTFQAFRARLTLHEKEGLVFEKSVMAARDAGLLPPHLQVALDSSPVRGRGAVKDTFNLLSDAIVGVLRAVAGAGETSLEQLAQQVGLERHVEAPSIKGSEPVDWSNPAAVSGFLAGLLKDCDRTLALAQQAEVSIPETTWLQAIIDQDIDRGDGQTPPKIRRGVAKDRMPSVSDPEIRHGRKSSGKTYTGHKAHVAVDISSGVITAVDITAPGEADGGQVKTLLEQTVELTGREVDKALGDSAYSSREAQRQAQQVEVDLHTKMPSPRRDYYGPGDFEVSADGHSARCPAGHPSVRQSLHRAKDRPQERRHLWSEQLCGACPLKEFCTPARLRSLGVAEDFHDRRQREQYAASPEGRAELRQRVVVEHAIARLKNLGAGVSRYFGRAKTGGQWQWTAALANLSLVWNATPEMAVIGH